MFWRIRRYKRTCYCLAVALIYYMYIVIVGNLPAFVNYQVIRSKHSMLPRSTGTVLTAPIPVLNERKVILFYNPPKWSPRNVDFSECDVNNCLFTTNKSLFNKSHAVIFHNPSRFRPLLKKKQGQVWIYHVHEPPTRISNLKNWNNLFNWTFTYRRDSDFASVYAELVPVNASIAKNKVKLNKLSKTKAVAWFVSRCKVPSRRDLYVNGLKRYIKVDTYGRCGNLTCHECEKNLEDNYKFYLAFENSLCRDYVTEKAFRGVRRKVIPVVRGNVYYDLYFPDQSYISTNDFRNISMAANLIRFLDSNIHSYEKYLQRSQRYVTRSDVVDDFYPQHLFCRLCARLNRNNADDKRLYSNLQEWFAGSSTVPICVQPNDIH